MQVNLVEVGPRDGFQAIPAIIATEEKEKIIRGLYDAGLRRVEITSVVSNRALPQLSDAGKIISFGNQLSGCLTQVLVANAKYASIALKQGARKLVFVVSASQTHNQKNVRLSVEESLGEFREIAAMHPPTTPLRVNIATALDCPFEGTMSVSKVMHLVEQILAISANVELAICDTTGRNSPRRVTTLFNRLISDFDQENWVFHAHDTYGMGIANCLAAWHEGVKTFDSSIGGLGGCPYAPGSSGNVATEDLVWLFEDMSIDTGVDMDMLLTVAETASSLPTALTGGKVRQALKNIRSA